jgi:preprotein translocase subunit SecF
MTATTAETRTGFRQTLRDIYHERTRFDFIGHSWLWALISGVLVAVSVAALVLSGLNLGIDFEGGTQWQFTVASGKAVAGDVRDVMAEAGITDAKILILGDDEVRVQAGELGTATPREVRAALATYAGIDAPDVSLTDVGPTWGDRVSSKALVALGVFFGLIALYLTMRFEWKMALAAIMAVVHDIAITVGVYAISGFEVTPATVIAFLTILGFSLYDTVVVFDKIRENTPSLGAERGVTYSSMVNRSMNSVLMRSLNTSFVALLPVASLLVVGSGILGAVTLRDFALALFVGLLVGAYSSIFVATPILAWIKEREPRYQALRTRSMAQMAKADVGERVTSGTSSAEGSVAGSVPPRGPGSITPRPRQQRRRRRR